MQFLALLNKKKYWHKYGGNWQEGSKTISYRLQRWLLIKNIPGKVFVSERNKVDPIHLEPQPTKRRMTRKEKICMPFVNFFLSLSAIFKPC